MVGWQLDGIALMSKESHIAPTDGAARLEHLLGGDACCPARCVSTCRDCTNLNQGIEK
jgi:hypothetical protein